MVLNTLRETYHSGFFGLYRIAKRHNATPIAAAPITVPGCPPLNLIEVSTESASIHYTHLLRQVCAEASNSVNYEFLVRIIYLSVDRGRHGAELGIEGVSLLSASKAPAMSPISPRNGSR